MNARMTLENRKILRQAMLCGLRTGNEAVDRNLALIVLTLLNDVELLEKSLQEAGQSEMERETRTEGVFEDLARNPQIESLTDGDNSVASEVLRNVSFLGRECRDVVGQLERVRLRLTDNADAMEMSGSGDFVRNLLLFTHDFRDLSGVMDRLRQVLHQFYRSLTPQGRGVSGAVRERSEVLQ